MEQVQFLSNIGEFNRDRNTILKYKSLKEDKSELAIIKR